jgi:putative membrane protein
MASENSLEERVSSLEKYLFKAPPWRYTVLLIAAYSILAGFLFFNNPVAGFLLIGLTAVISFSATFAVAKVLGGIMTPNRSALISAIDCAVITIFLLAGNLLSALQLGSPQTVYQAFVVGLGCVFGCRTVILTFVSMHELKAIVPASFQTLLSFVSLQIYFRPNYFSSAVIFALFLCSAFLYVGLINRPLRKMFGVSGTDFVTGYLALNENPSILENFFDRIGEEVTVPITALSFAAGEKRKVLFVIPSIHPGPVGEVGGGNLASKIAELVGGKVLTFHGAVQYDFSPTSSDGVRKVADAVSRAEKKLECSNKATKSVRVKSGDARILAQKFGDSVLLISSFQGPAEDIEFGVGMSAVAEVRSAGIKNVVLADAHNSGAEDARMITSGSKHSYELIDAVRKAGYALSSETAGEMRMGISQRTNFSRAQGIGDLGIQAAVLEVLGQKTAYILIDGNNIVDGLRDELTKDLPVDEAEILTTDTHVVNIGRVHNYIGMSINVEELRGEIRKCVEDAVKNLEPVSSGMHTEVINVRVLGTGTTAQLVSAAKVILPMVGFLAVAFAVVMVTFSAVVITYFGV